MNNNFTTTMANFYILGALVMIIFILMAIFAKKQGK